MKRIIIILLVFTCTLSSCNKKNDGIDKIQEELQSVENVPFSFDKVADPSIWASFGSLKERQDACQMPENLLKTISTKNLVETCMNYPLYGMYLAYNNEMEGIKIIMDGFNGFAELEKREDAAIELLNYYEKITAVYTNFWTNNSYEQVRPLHLGYLELILASDKIPSLYNDVNYKRLEELMQSNLHIKIKNPETFSILSVSKSLLLGAKIKLEKYPLNSNDSIMLNNFLESGGFVSDPTVYTKISDIIK